MAKPGTLTQLDATVVSPAAPIAIGDVVQVSIPLTSVAGGTTPTVAIAGIGLAQFGGVLDDGDDFTVFFAAQQTGSATLTFTYTPAAGGAATVVKYTLDILTARPGRIIQVTGAGNTGTATLVDLATGEAPVGGVLVGDVLFYQVGSSNLLSDVSAGITGTGTAIQFSAIATDDNDIVRAYFAAVSPGSGSFAVSYVTAGGVDGGFISPAISVGL